LARCRAKTSRGNQCRNNAIPGTHYCYLKSHGASNATLTKRLINFIRNHLIGFVSLGLGIAALLFYLHDKNITATSGLIKSDGTANRKYIAVGSTRFIVDSPDNIFLREGTQPLVSLRIENQKLYVSSTIRNKNGEIIAELKDNEWQLNENSYFDRNYNDQVLEVRDNSGNIVLQLANFGNVIHFAGIFNCKNGKTYALIPTGQSGAIMEMRPKGIELEHKIDPICEYPSDLHFGSCPGYDSLKELTQVSNSGGYRLGGSLEICK